MERVSVVQIDGDGEVDNCRSNGLVFCCCYSLFCVARHIGTLEVLALDPVFGVIIDDAQTANYSVVASNQQDSDQYQVDHFESEV